MENRINSRKWSILGPGGGGGQFIPTISPHDPDTILVACDMTGAYITYNGGSTWRQFNLKARVNCFAFDPVIPGTIYAGSSGLFRSTDNGEKWKLIYPDPASGVKELMLGDHADHLFVSGDNWPGGSVQAIVADPVRRGDLFIGIYTNKKLYVYRSQNNGRDWAKLCSVKGSEFHKLYLDPQSDYSNRRLFIFTDECAAITTVKDLSLRKLKLPDSIKTIIHAACGIDPVSGIPLFYMTVWVKKPKKARSIGIWKSEDGGGTWIELDIQPGGVLAGPETGLFPAYTLLAVPESDGRHIYAGIGGALDTSSGGYPEIPDNTGAGSVISYFGVIKSHDKGKTWTWVLKSDYGTDPDNLSAGWAERDYDMPWFMTGPKGVGPIGLNASPVEPGICCYTDLSSTFITTDGGNTWKQVYTNNHKDSSVSTRGIDVTTCYGVHFDPFDKDHIVISYTDIGMFHSKDGGRTWFHAIKDLPVSWGNTCYWMVFDPDVKGRAWSVWGEAHDLPRPKMFASGKFNLWQGGVCRCENGPDMWMKSNDGMPGNSVATHIVLDTSSPVGKRILYTAVFDKGVYKSTDDGFSWMLKNNGIKGNLNAWRIIMLPDGTLYLLVARGLNNGREIEGALYISTDGAEHWQRLPLPDGVNAPNDMAFDPDNPKRMYLACWPSERDGRSMSGGLYVTVDGGYSWRNVFDESAHVYGIAVHPDNPSIVFIVTFNSAAYRSDDKGLTWSRIKGYNFKWGHRPVIDPYNKDMLYITTFGSSVWYGPASGDEDAFEDIMP